MPIVPGCVSAPPPPSGQTTFMTHCASCHGRLAEGDGPMVDVLRVNVPNLRQLGERNGGTFPADAVAGYIDGRNLPVAHGDRVMPVWGDIFDTTSRILPDAQAAEQRIDNLVDWLGSIQYDSP
ncbi:MAG TPA: cytochrome c [Gammaproteobacteria bacterium]|nr:cytochrome c [Gammaproteobacteria bacterium]